MNFQPQKNKIKKINQKYSNLTKNSCISNQNDHFQTEKMNFQQSPKRRVVNKTVEF